MSGWAPVAWSWTPTGLDAGTVQLGSLPVLLDAAYPDGDVIMIPRSEFGGPYVVIGTGPLTDAEWCAREARRIVHEGLADVLEWLRWPKYTPPSSERLLARLRGLSEAHAGVGS